MKRLLLILFVALICSCTAYKNIPYVVDSGEIIEIEAAKMKKQIEIKIDDVLSIEVSTTNPKSAEPFNLNSAQTSTSGSGSNNNSSMQGKVYGYLVDADGNIDFPVVGKLHVAGLTNIEASDLVRESLSSYLKERPVVRIRIINFQISVLGEVGSPGAIEIDSEKINIFEAIALAGDMTIYGNRHNVKVMRELPSGKHKIVTLNLQRSNIVNSEFYYLQQNDIIYVEPNKSKANTSGISASTTIWITFTSALMSIASFVLAFVL